MKIEELNKLLAKPALLNKRIEIYKKKKIITKVPFDLAEIKGHMEKSEHDLKFVNDNMGPGSRFKTKIYSGRIKSYKIKNY